MKEFGKRIDDLRDPSLSVEEKKRFLEGVVDQIDVSSVDTQTHELQIKFAFSYTLVTNWFVTQVRERLRGLP